MNYTAQQSVNVAVADGPMGDELWQLGALSPQRGTWPEYGAKIGKLNFHKHRRSFEGCQECPFNRLTERVKGARLRVSRF